MSTSVIGALRVVLGMDSASFDKGLTKAERELNRFGKEMARTGAKLASAGQALTLGVTLPIIGIGVASMRAAQESADALAQVQASLASMGNASGKTLGDLEAQAERLMNASLFDDDDILRSVTANLLTFGKIAGPTFDRAQTAVVDLATKMRMDLQSATILVGKALNDPVKGLTALGRSGVQFTASQKELIKSLVATGQTAKAQSLILAELERQFGGSAKAAQDANPYNKMQDSLNTLSETIGKKLIPTFQPLVEKLNALLVKFTELSPAVQNNIIIWGAVAAAIGPVLIGIGAMASSVQVLIPLLVTAAGANGALGLAIGGLMSPVGLLVAAAAALTIGFVALGQSYSDAAIAARATKQAHERLDPILNTVSQSLALAAASAGDTQKAYLAAARAAFLLGEREIEGARKAVAAARARVAATAEIERLTPGAYVGMASAQLDLRAKEAEAALKAAEDRLIGAGVARRRGSRGRGTTFVLIDPVEAFKEEQAARGLASAAGALGDEVATTGGRARAAKEDTRDWADELVNLREQLATPIQREIKTTTDQIALLTEGLEKGKYTAYEVAQALRLINEQVERDRFADTIVKIDQNPTLDGPKLPETGTFGGRVMSKQTADDLKAEMTDTFRGALDALRYGGAKGVFEYMADHFSNRLLDNLANQLTSLFDQIMGQMGGGSSGGSGWLNAIASIFGGGSPQSPSGGWIPGFATGGGFTVGGSGGIDSKIAQMRLTPGEHVNITKGERDSRQGSTNVFDMRGAVVTQDLLNQMNQIAASGDAQVIGAIAREKQRGDKASRYTVARARR
jgi:hypothetical protein